MIKYIRLKKKCYLIIGLLLSIGCETTYDSDEEFVEDTIRVAFYNVENLFDTNDDPITYDEEFLPSGDKNWTYQRYQDKLIKIAAVIDSLKEPSNPALVGLCEIENEKVLKDLISVKGLSPSDYAVVHKESRDYRGIDVALIYNTRLFDPFVQKDYEIVFPDDPDYKTRDILKVSGVMGKTDTLHILVNHFPSRRGGQQESEPKRLFVASKLKAIIDEIYQADDDAKIIVMGDFNDEPYNKSIREVLEAEPEISEVEKGELYNTLAKPDREGQGSYKYRGNWNMLDQIMVSPALLSGSSGYFYLINSAEVFKKPWLLQQEGDYIGYPDRTYAGSKYLGGYSDHLPVFVDLYLMKKL